MSTVETRDARNQYPSRLPEERRGAETTAAGGSLLEAGCGVAVIVLTILGLAHILSGWMVGISIVVLGAALMLEGTSVMARFRALFHEGEEPAASQGDVGGVSAEFLGGVAGIVLGVLTLCHVAAVVLPPIAAIVFGASLLVASGSRARLADLANRRTGMTEWSTQVARETVSSASAAQLLTGIAGVVLGIIGLTLLPYAWVLTLVAVLSMGAGTFLSGLDAGDRLMVLIHR